ncbi:MAG: GAF domain-containing sensor histidine kinase [Leptospiraceae bacterium]|nr:GAF domain-containing sensor histidine kinase [Leptospiraceae bacterium]MCP5500544.1 GAF domain-containing sensor histidine kinase [Leptospiraceae bacterium]
MISKEQYLWQVFSNVKNSSPEHLISSITQSIGLITGLDYVFIGKLDSIDSSLVRTHGLWARGNYADNFCYALTGTPCAQVWEGETCFFGEDVSNLFPDDILLDEMKIKSYIGVPLKTRNHAVYGLLVVLHSSLIENASTIQEFLDLFGQWVSSELEYIDTSFQNKKQLQELNEFNHIISHSLRAPLANLLGFIELAGEMKTIGEDSIHFLESNLSILHKVSLNLNKITELHKRTREHFSEVELIEIFKQISVKYINTILNKFTESIFIKTDKEVFESMLDNLLLLISNKNPLTKISIRCEKKHELNINFQSPCELDKLEKPDINGLYRLKGNSPDNENIIICLLQFQLEYLNIHFSLKTNPGSGTLARLTI